MDLDLSGISAASLSSTVGSRVSGRVVMGDSVTRVTVAEVFALVPAALRVLLAAVASRLTAATARLLTREVVGTVAATTLRAVVLRAAGTFLAGAFRVAVAVAMMLRISNPLVCLVFHGGVTPTRYIPTRVGVTGYYLRSAFRALAFCTPLATVLLAGALVAGVALAWAICLAASAAVVFFAAVFLAVALSVTLAPDSCAAVTAADRAAPVSLVTSVVFAAETFLAGAAAGAAFSA